MEAWLFALPESSVKVDIYGENVRGPITCLLKWVVTRQVGFSRKPGHTKVIGIGLISVQFVNAWRSSPRTAWDCFTNWPWRFSKVATFGERAEDVFFLTDERGKPFGQGASQRLTDLADAILARLDGVPRR